MHINGDKILLYNVEALSQCLCRITSPLLLHVCVLNQMQPTKQDPARLPAYCIILHMCRVGQNHV
jgi:hypothetical protein